MKFNENQLLAINADTKDILVSAAAGSGKTAVLVNRIIKKISDPKNPVDIDRLAVLTFTEAAANEMKERIGKALESASHENPNLNKQIALLNNAQISTIHKFCIKIIRDNFNFIGIDPNFKISDTSEGELIKDEVMEEFLEEKYEDSNEKFSELLELFVSKVDDFNFKTSIYSLYDFLMAMPYPEKFLEKTIAEYDFENKNIEDSIFLIESLERFDKELELAIEKIMQAIEIAQTDEGPLNYLENFEDDLEMILELKTAKSWDEKYKQVNFIEFGRLKNIGEKDACDESLKTQAKGLRDEVKDLINSLKDIVYLDLESIRKHHINLYYDFLELRDFMLEFIDRFRQEKRRRNILDFNDIEHYALKILIDDENEFTESANILKNYYKEIYIDEYQDINAIQDLIIEAVSRKSIGEHNRFMVGDIKQGIYRFRQAKPELFKEKYKKYEVKSDKETKIELEQNYRSRKNVIDFVNFVFEKIMYESFAEIDYNEKTKLYQGADYEDIDGNDYSTEVFINNKKENEKNESYQEVEARFIAIKIKELISSEYQVFDKNESKYRKIRYSDIVILLRAMPGFIKPLADELSLQAIPSYIEGVGSFYDTLELMTILNYLRIIDNPRQDIAIVSVLKSEIYKLSSDDLFSIKLSSDEKSYFDAVNNYLISEDKDEGIAKILLKFLDDLEYFHYISLHYSLDKLLWTIFNRTKYFYFVGIMDAGKLRQDNLKMLVEKAIEFEKSKLKGLFNFLKYIENISKIKKDFAEAKSINELENLVRVMTMHKSKGLESPIVFIAGLGKKFNIMDLSKPLLMQEEYGIATKYIDNEKNIKYPSFIYNHIAYLKKRENLAEEMRVLYVALTRAREKLFLTASVDDFDKFLDKHKIEFKNKLDESFLISQIRFIDWLMPLFIRHPDIVDSLDLNIKKKDEYSSIELKLLNEIELKEDKKEEVLEERPLLTALNDETFKKLSYDKKIKDELDWEYKYLEESKTMAQLSVSEIKRRFQEESNLIESFESRVFLPNIFEEDKVESTLLGQAMHTVVEKLDFSKEYEKDDIKNFLNKLLEDNVLSEKEAQAVNKKRVFNFTQSDVYKRMLLSNKIYKEKSFIAGVKVDEFLGDSNIKEKVVLRGVIDCYFEENDYIVLLDYKNDYIKEGEEEKFIEKYKIQLEIYKYFIEDFTNKKVRDCILYSFYLSKEFFI